MGLFSIKIITQEFFCSHKALKCTAFNNFITVTYLFLSLHLAVAQWLNLRATALAFVYCSLRSGYLWLSLRRARLRRIVILFPLFFLYCSLYSKVFEIVYHILEISFHFSLFLDYFTHFSPSSSFFIQIKNSLNKTINILLKLFTASKALCSFLLFLTFQFVLKYHHLICEFYNPYYKIYL